jgi:hypothetical protein
MFDSQWSGMSISGKQVGGRVGLSKPGWNSWMTSWMCRLLAWQFVASCLLFPGGLATSPVPPGLLGGSQIPRSQGSGPVEDDIADNLSRLGSALQESWLRPAPSPIHRRSQSFGTGLALLSDEGRAVRGSLRSGPFLASGRQLRLWIESHIC